ncbi:MAG: choice-of-anchor E domain-containing protein [Pseudomonadota bacterium]
MRRLLFGLVLGLMPFSAGAATVSNTYFIDREISFTDSSRGSIYSSSPRLNTIDVDEFDTSLGTLTGIRLDYEIAFLLSVNAFDDPGIFDRAEVEANVRGFVLMRAGTTSTGALLDGTSRTLTV